jgi:HEXXH motif-containing protein
MDCALWGSVPALLRLPPPEHPIAEVLRHGVTQALDFGAYFDLALGPPDGSPLCEALRGEASALLLRRLGEVTSPDAAGLDKAANLAAARPVLRAFALDAFSPAELDRLARWWDIEPENSMGLTAPSPEAMHRAVTFLGAAFDHLAAAAPTIHDEVCALLSEIVIGGQDGSQRLDFNGVSSFSLWGTFVFNADTHGSWPQSYRTLVHEAAHNLLFAIARDEPLVQGGGAQRSHSPLRRSMRPMDGIYHAAFVSAREAIALDQLLLHHEKSPCLDQEEVSQAAAMLDESVLVFWDCADVVHREAELTGLGDAVLSDCEAAMRRNFAVEAA